MWTIAVQRGPNSSKKHCYIMPKARQLFFRVIIIFGLIFTRALFCQGMSAPHQCSSWVAFFCKTHWHFSLYTLLCISFSVSIVLRNIAKSLETLMSRCFHCDPDCDRCQGLAKPALIWPTTRILGTHSLLH